MQITIKPNTKFEGTVKIPGSKSITHRAIICGVLSNKEITINNANLCEDTLITIELLKSLGALIKVVNNTILISPSTLHDSNILIDAKNSGSSIRFLIPLCYYLFKSFKVIVDSRMVKRLLDTSNDGITFDITKINEEKSIIKVASVNDSLLLNNSKTTQYASGIMMYKSYLENTLIMPTINELPSNPYILMTKDVINSINKVSVYNIEGDYSLASSFLVMGLLTNNITCQNLTKNSIQGDYKIIEYLKKMNGTLKINETSITSYESRLHPVDLNMEDTPDLVLELAALMAVTKGVSKIEGIEKLKYKETDRLNETINILNKLGSNLVSENNSIIINGTNSLNNPSYLLLPNDHRLVMMVLSISSTFQNEIILDGIEATTKSYINYITDFLNLRREYENN